MQISTFCLSIFHNTFSLFLLGILRDDSIPLSLLSSDLSVSQQRALHYISDILTTMETVSNEYNDCEIDENYDDYCEVCFLVTIILVKI